MYRLNWVQLSRAYDIDNPFVPQLDAKDTVNEETGEADQDQDGDDIERLEGPLCDEDIGLTMQTMSPAPSLPEDLYRPSLETCDKEKVPYQLYQSDVDEDIEGTTDQDGDGLQDENDEERDLSDSMEGLEWLFSDEYLASSVQKLNRPTAPPMLEDLYHSFFDEYEDYELSKQCRLDASVTVDDETKTITNQDWDSLHIEIDDENGLSDDMEGLEQLFSDVDLATAPSLPGSFFPEKDEIENIRLPEVCYKENSTLQAQCGDSLCNRDDEEHGKSNEMEGTSEHRYSDEDLVMFVSVYHSFDETYELQNNDLPEMCNKENSTPQGHILSAAFHPMSQPEMLEYSGMNSEKRSTASIWSRRGKPKSVNIKTSQSRGNYARINGEVETLLDRNCLNASMLKDQFESPDNPDEIYTPDKENTSPDSYLVGSLKYKFEETLKVKSISNGPISSVDQDEELFTSDKENVTPNSHLLKSVKNSCRPSPLKIAKSISSTPVSKADQDEEIFTPDKENVTPNSHLLKSMKNYYRPSPLKIANNSQKVLQESIAESRGGSKIAKSISSSRISNADQDEEIFTPDKENVTPNSHLLKSMNYYRPSPLKIANNSQKVLQESIAESQGGLKKKQSVSKAREVREPFYPLLVNSTSKLMVESIPCRSVEYLESEDVNQLHKNVKKVNNNRWTIIADTTSLLNRKSRKELQLMRGLRGTTLVIPRIVVRELDCIIKRASFFSRTTEATAALNWIEECMASTKWWIHVQSSAEEGMLIPPTPPAAPSPRWFNEEKSIFSVASTPFSPYSLQEIVTPTAADHILDCTLLLRRTMNGQLVLLSDDVTLKIKAMVEGVICETAGEFRRSLVNPLSSRFLYSDSSAIGPTWSCSEDTVLKEKYYASPAKKTPKSGDCAKGLKLILLHNSNFRQKTY